MLADSLNQWNKYDLGPFWAPLMTWITQEGPTAEPGKYSVADCTVIISDNTTRPLELCRYESHRHMADIQMLLRGEEWIYVADTAALPLAESFDEGRDIGFHQSPDKEASRVLLRPGNFALLFPWDAHMPCVAEGEPASVRKLLVKFPYDKVCCLTR